MIAKIVFLVILVVTSLCLVINVIDVIRKEGGWIAIRYNCDDIKPKIVVILLALVLALVVIYSL